MTETQQEQYDPEVHDTAKELRERGFKIPGSIPDVAWIRKGAWRLAGDVKAEMDGTLLKMQVGSLIFLEPFRWDTLKVSVKADE